MIIYDNIIVYSIILAYVLTKRLDIVLLTLIFIMVFLNSPDHSNFVHRNDMFYSPSAGYIQSITQNNETLNITIFLNIFDNHTQYIPIKSKLVNVIHHNGMFLPAFNEHAVNNDRKENLLYAQDYDMKYTITQITGILTRRIITLAENEKAYSTGDRLGFIILGSRVDISIPVKNVEQVLVTSGTHIDELTPIVQIKKIDNKIS